MMSLTSPALQKSKGVCEDLTEGKVSFLTLHALRTSPRSAELRRILAMRTKRLDLLTDALTILNEAGSFEYTGSRWMQLFDETMGLLTSIRNETRDEIDDFSSIMRWMQQDVVECLRISSEASWFILRTEVPNGLSSSEQNENAVTASPGSKRPREDRSKLAS